MRELGKKELQGLLRFNQNVVAIFIYSPMCGTCQLAAQMLHIVEKSLSSIRLYRLDINLIPEIAQKWHIQSVPCIVIVQRTEVIKKVYAMHSTTKLYNLLYPLQENKIPK